MKAKTSHFEKKTSFFITFEGGEGAGKTTQIKHLADYLAPKVVVTREPGGTAVADQIRATLLDPKNKISPELELLLYEAARRDHVENIIRPALKAGKIVLCDRFTDATIAYQGFARGLSLKLIDNLNTIATGGLTPDLTFLFDLSPKIGLSRVRKGRSQLDRLEKEKLLFHEKVRKGYLTLARKNKKRFFIIDATEQPHIISSKILHEVEKRLRRKS